MEGEKVSPFFYFQLSKFSLIWKKLSRFSDFLGKKWQDFPFFKEMIVKICKTKSNTRPCKLLFLFNLSTIREILKKSQNFIVG